MTDERKIAGVVGDPVSHSLSPRLHGYWLNKYKINGEYHAFHVTASELPAFLTNLAKSGIDGVNLTVPHKEHAMSLVDEVDGVAQKIGAINTVYFNEAGKLIGTNTDGYGFLSHLKQSAPHWSGAAGPAMILGAGGAARAALVSLLEENVPEIRLCNRTNSRALRLAGELADPRIKTVLWQDRADALAGCSLLVNVTLLGMEGQPALSIDLSELPQNAVVYDIVYNPLETDLLKNARTRGNLVVDGLGMLLHQAAPGFKAWFGIMPLVDNELRQHVLKGLK